MRRRSLLRVEAPHELARFFPPLFLDEVLEHSSPFIDRVVTINGRQLLINTFPAGHVVVDDGRGLLHP